MAKPPDPPDEAPSPPTRTPDPKRKASNNTTTPRKVSNNNTTPRKISHKAPNGPRTPVRKASGTPRKVSGNGNGGKTPTSAPGRVGSKKEPTLLGDFLLGRPSPQRQRTARRRNSEVGNNANGGRVEMMRTEAVGRVKPEGKVKDRVLEWQKESVGPEVKNKDEVRDVRDEIVVEIESESEDNRARRPGKRKEDEGRARCKSAAAPRKRVISDDHWMRKGGKEKEKKVEGKGSPIPKGFLIGTANPPVESKIQDWMGRTGGVERPGGPRIGEKEKTPRSPRIGTEEKNSRSPRIGVEDDKKPRSRNVSSRNLEEEHRRQDDGIRATPSRDSSTNDGIRIKPSKDRPDDGIRITPEDTPTKNSRGRFTPVETPDSTRNKSKWQPTDDGMRIIPENTPKKPKNRPSDEGIRIKPSRENSPDGSSGRNGSRRDVLHNPKQRSEKHLRPPQAESRRTSYATEEDEEIDKFSWMSPSPPENSKRRNRKSGSPVSDDIPFGNSAFSVLDLPVGAEAGTMRRPGPKRNNSFAAVPKVLKRVYNEGMKIVHDNAEPRAGPNQPPSIESWLNGTSDPFVDQPAGLEVPESSSRRCSYKEDDRTERELTAEHEENPRRKRTVTIGSDQPSPVMPKNRETLPSMESSPPISPTGLKRSPATRTVTSPKSSRKVPLKEAIFDAFKGESAVRTKGASPSPFDFIGLRERDTRPEPRDRGLDLIDEDTPRSRRVSVEKPRFEEQPGKPLPAFPRRVAPTTGGHRLSTIASVETFSTSSASESVTGSELSQTTVTQNTAFTGPTSSSLSRKSNKSGLKRRLTKHSDLLSVLSLPDPPEPTRMKSIQSARSIRTSRAHLETATAQDLLRELAEDETKYMRELNTLVGGVIPVLLTSVLSKSDSAVAAGLLDPKSPTKSSLTKPIVDMGVALERLRSLHKRIPLNDSESFLHWLDSAHKIYKDYLLAWRTGFEGVIVNLAPSQRADDDEKMSVNNKGDVIGENGEVVDVSFLLKRPVLRVKHLTRLAKGFYKIETSPLSKGAMDTWVQQEDLARARIKEEAARREDQRTNATDATRARHLRTLAACEEEITINQCRQVAARDSFSMELPHSSGQKIECQIEMILRDTPADANNADLLIVEIDPQGSFLLFAPIVGKENLSARLGDHESQLVVMIRGTAQKELWSETIILESNDPEAVADWLCMLPSSPVPPPIVRKDMVVDPNASELSAATSVIPDDIPIGESRQKTKERTPKQRRHRKTTAPASVSECLEEEPMHSLLGELCILDVKDLNHARAMAGMQPLAEKKKKPTRYHSPKKSDVFPPFMSGALPLSSDKDDSMPASATTDRSTPLKDSMRPSPDSLKSTPRGDRAPPPPAHRSPTTPKALKTAVLDSPTPKAKNRRTSSPLKHEWQPSDASGTSSPSTNSGSDLDSYSDSSEDELEAVDSLADLPPLGLYRKVTPPKSIYSLPNGSVAPSNSASQAPSRGTRQEVQGDTKRAIAQIFCWNEKGTKGAWIELWPELCAIVISAGLVKVYEVNASAFTPPNQQSSGSSDVRSEAESPLLALDFTPYVLVRNSSALDIEVTTAPLGESRLLSKCPGKRFRFRTINVPACRALYNAINYARCNNPIFNKLEEERRINNYGSNAYERAIAPNTRRSFFGLGRQASYRGRSRAPQSDVASEQSGKSAMSALKRLSGGGLFNIARSSVNRNGLLQSASSSDYSGATPPGTPGNPSMADSSSYSTMEFTSEDLPIHFFQLVTQSKWEDQGKAFLTVCEPPPGVRPASSLDHGVPKRIIITRKKLATGTGFGKDPNAQYLLDIVTGVGSFRCLALKGIVIHDWRDIRDAHGTVGTIGATGGVAGTFTKYLITANNGRMRDWIWSLTGGLHNPRQRRTSGYAV